MSTGFCAVTMAPIGWVIAHLAHFTFTFDLNFSYFVLINQIAHLYQWHWVLIFSWYILSGYFWMKKTIAAYIAPLFRHTYLWCYEQKNTRAFQSEFFALGFLRFELWISIDWYYNVQKMKSWQRFFCQGVKKVNFDPKYWYHQGTNISPDTDPNYTHIIET